MFVSTEEEGRSRQEKGLEIRMREESGHGLSNNKEGETIQREGKLEKLIQLDKRLPNEKLPNLDYLMRKKIVKEEDIHM